MSADLSFAQQYQFIVDALREAGHGAIADIAEPLITDPTAEHPNGTFGNAYNWRRLGRCPTLDEIRAVRLAEGLLYDVVGADPGHDRATYPTWSSAEEWHDCICPAHHRHQHG